MIGRLRRLLGNDRLDPVPGESGNGGPEGTLGAGGDLRLVGIEKRFGAVAVLGGVSLDVRAGEFLTLLGPSGCGKTTLLRIVAGLERADAGQVFLGERAIDRVPANRRPVNTVFQSYALFPHLDVFGNVAFGLRARGQGAAEVSRRVGDALDLLRLNGLAERRPDALSGGQRQRVALARALVNEPEVLLLDEPLSALDAKLRAEVQVELRRLQRRLGTTFVLVTHDQDEAMTVSDRMVILNEGKVEQVGPTAEVYERPRTRFVAEFLGAANLLPAEVLEGSRVRTALGDLSLSEAPGWRQGTLAIHPEAVSVRAEAPACNGVRVTVEDAVYRGDHVELRVTPLSPGAALRVQAAPALRPDPGAQLWLELPAERLCVLVD